MDGVDYKFLTVDEFMLLEKEGRLLEKGKYEGRWCGVVWCGVVWCDVAWRGVVWCGVAWRGVVWRGVAWRGVVWWCGGVVWWDDGFRNDNFVWK